jgi:hypothetical protein
VTKQLLLDVDRGVGTAEQGSVGMPKGVPSNAAETILGCKLTTFVMDRDGIALSTLLIPFGARRPRRRTTARTRNETPSRAADVVLLNSEKHGKNARWRDLGTTGRTRLTCV